MAQPRIRNVLALYREIDPHLRERARITNATCSKGCAYCCYNLTLITFFEAIVIAQHLLSTGADIDGIVKTLWAQCRHFEDPNFTRTTYFQAHMPCAFLTKENCCGVYDIRPGVCRSYYVATAPELCGEPTGSEILAVVNVREILTYFAHEIFHMNKEARLPDGVFPMQVAIPWAIVWLRDGRKAFEKKQAAATGPRRLDFWVAIETSDAPFVRGPDSVHARVLFPPADLLRKRNG